jgi:hypothetical protein
LLRRIRLYDQNPEDAANRVLKSLYASLLTEWRDAAPTYLSDTKSECFHYADQKVACTNVDAYNENGSYERSTYREYTEVRIFSHVRYAYSYTQYDLVRFLSNPADLGNGPIYPKLPNAWEMIVITAFD